MDGGDFMDLILRNCDPPATAAELAQWPCWCNLERVANALATAGCSRPWPFLPPVHWIQGRVNV